MPRNNEDLDDIDLDLDQDLDNDRDNDDVNTSTNQPPIGDQDDGSVVVELEEEDPENSNVNTETDDDKNKSETDEELEAKREQRRQERAERKQRQREKQERLNRELQAEREARRALEERLSAIERKSSGAELAQIDNAIKQTKQAYDYYKDQIRVAQESNDGAAIAEATEKMILASNRITQLDTVKKGYQQKQTQAAPLDSRLVSNADKFMSKHTWFKPDGRDNDSAILRTLDNQVAQEGWDPTTDAYWNELDERIKKYLPHRSKSAKVTNNDNDDDGTPSNKGRQKSIVTGSGRESQVSAGGKNTFRLSRERVEALKEAGMWDDPKQRTEAIKRFRDFDKAQKGR